MKIKDIIKVADFFTIGNLIFGMLSIYYAISALFQYALVFLLVAMTFDFLDGKVARISKKVTDQGRHFGKELDSLSDVVSFGVAPAVFGYTLGLQSWWEILVLLFFTTAGMLRLSRFNITESHGYFEGVPITVNGLLFPILFLIHLKTAYQIEYALIAYVFMGFAMMSSRKVKKIL
jgi:CDP-diacylglycerol--serine O-phosphatidyltransferase